MNQIWTVEMFIHLTTVLCALLLLPRSANWRLRLVIGAIGLQALAQCMTQLQINHPYWQSRLGVITGNIEMLCGALALTAIYLLKQENSERKSTDARLRLSEAVEAVPELSGIGMANGLAAATGEVTESLEPGPKQRKARRFAVSVLAQITQLDGDMLSYECEIGDISQGGVRVAMPVHIPPGSPVKMEFREFLFLGEVRWEEESDGIFFAGIQFERAIDLTNFSKLLRDIGLEKKGTGVQMRTV
ncbi:MAG: PilZ domain-containing protein [Acidobacteriota bacterium]